MKSHKINQFFGRYAAFLLRWRWAATDQIHVLIGYDYFYADAGMFKRYEHNSEVWFKLKYCY